MFDKIKESKFVVFDCETTGLDWNRGNQIIELAGQKIVDGQVIDEFYTLINPTVPVEEGAYSVHGLSNLYLAEHGEKAEIKLPEFKKFVEDSILVGHNILTFDLPFLNAELTRIQHSPLDNMLIDTLVMARKILPMLPNHKLSTVAEYYGVDSKGAHRAMKDVEMNKEVFLRMLDEYMKHLASEQSKRDTLL